MINLLLKDIAQRENFCVRSNASLRDLVELMNINQKGVVVVLQDDRPVGILTERDIVEILFREICLDEKVEKHAKKNLVTTRGDRTIGYAMNLMIDNNIRRIIVTGDTNRFEGIVTHQDLLKYLEEDFYRMSVKVRHILRKTGVLSGVTPDAPLNHVLESMVENGVCAVPVIKDKTAVGIITEKDILKLAFNRVSLESRAEEHMSSPVHTASLDTPVVEVVEVMNYRNIRRMVIVNREGHAINIVNVRDVIENMEGDYSRFLERKLNHAKEILNLLPEMLIEVTDTGTEQIIIWANDKIIDWFGREILGRPVDEFIPKEHWDIIYRTLHKVNKIEDMKLKKDGKIYELSGFFIRTDGTMENGRFQLMMRDITEDVRLSTIDPLTNIYNKRFMNGFLLKEIERSRRLEKQFSLVICDMDDFKWVNDTYGHLSGDMVIQSFAHVLKDTIRTLDVVGRYGGDEFIIILPETSAESAYGIINRLRMQIEGMEIMVVKNEKVKITASFGIATFPEDGMSSDDLIIASDERLYKAKNIGKNKIACR